MVTVLRSWNLKKYHRIIIIVWYKARFFCAENRQKLISFVWLVAEKNVRESHANLIHKIRLCHFFGAPFKQLWLFFHGSRRSDCYLFCSFIVCGFKFGIHVPFSLPTEPVLMAVLRFFKSRLPALQAAIFNIWSIAL